MASPVTLAGASGAAAPAAGTGIFLLTGVPFEGPYSLLDIIDIADIGHDAFEPVDGAEIDRIGHRTAARQLVDHARHDFLAGTGLAHDQHGDVVVACREVDEALEGLLVVDLLPVVLAAAEPGTDPALKDAKNDYFNNAPVGELFVAGAANLKPVYLGAKNQPVRDAVENALHLAFDFVQQQRQLARLDEVGDVVVGMEALAGGQDALANLHRHRGAGVGVRGGLGT